MRITVIGAGSVGAAIVQEMAQQDSVTQVQVCDVRARSLQEIHERVPNPSLRSFQVDARDVSVLASVARGSACIISCVPPDRKADLAELSLELGSHFCDLGGNDGIVRERLALSPQAEKRAVWIVPNCGLAPGLVNVLCLHGIDQFDEVQAAYLRVGDVPLHPREPFNFRISSSAEKILEDYTNPVQCIEGGSIVEYEPLTNEEALHFEEPFAEMEAFCTQGGLATLTETLVDRVDTLDHKTIRWPGHAHQMRFLLGLGLGERHKIDVRTHLTYRDVLVRRMRQRLGGPHEDAVLLRVVIQGRQDGRDRTLVYEMVERFDETDGMTAMEHCTSIPVAVVAQMLGEGHVPGGGAAPPELALPRKEYLDVIAERGLKVRSQWHDGHVGVNPPARDAHLA